MHLRRFQSHLIALGVAVVVILFGMAHVRSLEQDHVGRHREDAARLVAEYGRSLQLRVDRALDAGHVMAVVLENQSGDIDAVDTLAQELVALHGGVCTLGVAPDYVILRIYPQEGNQAALGHDLMARPLRRSQIRSAIQRGTAGLAGPQLLATGKIGFVSDVPVTVGQGERGNWGVVSVAFALEDLLAASGISRLTEAGYAFRIVAEQSGGETTEPLVIAASDGRVVGVDASDGAVGRPVASFYDLDSPVGAAIAIPNGSWMLYISPVQGWGHDTEGTFERVAVIFVGILAALFAFDVVRRPERLRNEVARATRDLARANRQLQAEVNMRGQVESALRQSESRASAILRNAADAIITVDETVAIRDYNPAAGRIFGYSREEILSRPLTLLMPDLDMDTLAEHFSALGDDEVAQTHPDRRSFIGQNRQGEPLDLVVALSRVKVQHNWLYTMILRNHTAQNRAERALRETRAQLDYVINRAPVVVFVLDENGVYTLSEGRGLTRLGRRPGESVGKSIFDVYPNFPEIHHAVRATLRGEPQSLLIRMGRTVFDVWYSPRYSETGAVMGVFGVAYDVTELKEAEEALRNVINTVADGVVTADSSGKIVMANQRMAEILGCDPVALEGQPLTTLFPPKVHGRVLRCLDDLRSGRIADSMERIEVEGMHADGHRVMLEVHLAQTHVGDQQQFTASINDISKQKELAQMRDDFISTVSHELRTPLAALIGWLDTLLGERPGPLTAEQRRFLNIALSGAERLNVLVDEILTVARITEGTLQLRMARFDPTAAVANTVAILTPLAETQSIRFVVEDEWPAGKQIVGDRARLEQVLTNLLNNAIKFSPEGSMVTLRSSYDNGRWQLEVTDQGIGIPPTELTRLYERFYRATNVRNSHMQGTGLGLFVSQSIIETHGGTIGHRNVNGDGHGTVAWFSVPVNPMDEDVPGELLEAAKAT